MEEITTRNDRLIDWLEGQRDADNKAILAALRKGLGYKPGNTILMYPHIMQFISDSDSEWIERSLFMIAALFSMHTAGGGDGKSIGQALAEVMDITQSQSIEQRFLTLLSSHPDDLAYNLRHAISLVKSKEIPIDWRLLLRDIQGWNHPDRYVQKRWARDFWRKRAIISETDLTENEIKKDDIKGEVV